MDRKDRAILAALLFELLLAPLTSSRTLLNVLANILGTPTRPCSRSLPLFATVIRLVAIGTTGISGAYRCFIPRDGAPGGVGEKNNIVVSSASRLTSAVSDERGSSSLASDGRKSANWIILGQSCLGKKSGMEDRVASDMPAGWRRWRRRWLSRSHSSPSRRRRKREAASLAPLRSLFRDGVSSPVLSRKRPLMD